MHCKSAFLLPRTHVCNRCDHEALIAIQLELFANKRRLCNSGLMRLGGNREKHKCHSRVVSTCRVGQMDTHTQQVCHHENSCHSLMYRSSALPASSRLLTHLLHSTTFKSLHRVSPR